MKRTLKLKRETLRQLTANEGQLVVGGLPVTNATQENCGTMTCPCGTGPESVCRCWQSGGDRTCPHPG